MKTKIIITSILLLVGVSIGVMKYWHLFPYIVIHGQVLDESNNTINNATVHAFFGVNDEEYTKTGDNGKFTTKIFSYDWSNGGKGPPGFSISIPGYRQYWGYLVKRKAWGPTFYNVKVKLQHGPEEPPIKEDL
jgi:hypothetical protein